MLVSARHTTITLYKTSKSGGDQHLSLLPVALALRGAPDIRLDADDIHVFRKVSILKGVESRGGE